jgi:3-(3-hydroxy-phenyl)propionate hydroxylase
VSTDTEVVIVGAGPTGLTLANILGMHGIRTLVVERNAATVGEPRAVSIDDESLRTMQYIDQLDTVRSGTVQGYGSHYFSASGSCFAKVLPDTMEYGYPRRSAFRQPVLEAQLREALQRFPSVQARLSTKVTRLSGTGEGVRVEMVGPDGNKGEVRAQYVAACDGGRSGIREALGIKMSGSTYDEKWLIVDLVGSTDRFRHTRVFCDPERPGLALPGPEGTRRYEFMMLPGEDPEKLLDESHVRALLARHSNEDAHLHIARKVIYHFHARMAERWRAGRIFLAGDAAHLTPPFAGQGMNSGVRDAQNLGWKLASCLRGALGPAALDSYESERKPHAWALIQMAVRMGHVMMPRSKLNAFLIQMAFRVLALYRPARDYVMQMKYKPQPHFEEGFVAGDAGLSLRGRMFPQPLVERRDGSRVLLDSVLGKGFAILEWNDGVLPLAGPRAHRALGAKVIRVIPREHRFLPVEAMEGIEEVRDVAGTMGPLLEPAGLRGVVLRPDRYVAACLSRTSDAEEADRMLDTLVRSSHAVPATSARTERLDLAIA